MKNKTLAKDYIERAGKRLHALSALFEVQAWADVVRESQEVVELALKALLRSCHIEVPRIHDVPPVLNQEQQRLPPAVREELKRYTDISRNLRRDQELAYYGSEDLTPSEFYTGEDAEKAMASARWVVGSLKSHIG